MSNKTLTDGEFLAKYEEYRTGGKTFSEFAAAIYPNTKNPYQVAMVRKSGINKKLRERNAARIAEAEAHNASLKKGEKKIDVPAVFEGLPSMGRPSRSAKNNEELDAVLAKYSVLND